MFGCLRPGCPVHCGKRRRPSCADRMLYRLLLVMLIAVLLGSLAAGLKDLRKAGGSSTVSKSAPFPGPQVSQLVGQT